jgi:hypothetical protein
MRLPRPFSSSLLLLALAPVCLPTAAREAERSLPRAGREVDTAALAAATPHLYPPGSLPTPAAAGQNATFRWRVAGLDQTGATQPSLDGLTNVLLAQLQACTAINPKCPGPHVFLAWSTVEPFGITLTMPASVTPAFTASLPPKYVVRAQSVAVGPPVAAFSPNHPPTPCLCLSPPRPSFVWPTQPDAAGRRKRAPGEARAGGALD